MPHDDYTVLIEHPMAARWKTKIVTAFATSPLVLVSAPKLQCTTAFMVAQSEPLWAFPESCTVNESQSERSDDGTQQENKSTKTLAPRGVSVPRIYVWVSTREQTRRYSQNLDRPLLSSQTLIIITLHYITLHYITSGNRTPGSRFYSDLLDILADFVCIHQFILKRRSKR